MCSKISLMPEGHSLSKPKLIVSLIFMTVLVVGGIWVFSRNQLSATEMQNARIIEVRDGSILVEGSLFLSNGVSTMQEVEFLITPETKLTKTTLIMDLSIPSDQAYTPQKTNEQGNISDLTPRETINRIVASENIYNKQKAVAVEVIYRIYKYENKPE